MKITLDKIASSTASLALPREVEISPHIEAKESKVLDVRALRMLEQRAGETLAVVRRMRKAFARPVSSSSRAAWRRSTRAT